VKAEGELSLSMLGAHKRMRDQDYSRNRAALHEIAWRRDMPKLQGMRLPIEYRHQRRRNLSIGDCLSIRSRTSSSTRLPGNKSRLSYSRRRRWAGGRRITPLHAGHVGLPCTAGLLNGVFGNGEERHIARWRSVKSVTVFEVKGKGYTEIHKREQFTNELALVYEDGRTLSLETRRERTRMQNARLRLG
jgi:hypothetical protein